MSNYTKSTNFASKDSLASGNPLKIVKGTEIDTEFNNIATAVATKTDNAAAVITGGTINNTTIGGTTPADAYFSNLTSTNASITSLSVVSSTYSSLFIANWTGLGINRAYHFADTSGTLAPSWIDASEYRWNIAGTTQAAKIDTSGNFHFFTTTSVPTLATSGELVITRVNNTTVKISMRGTDGTTRSVNLTLS